MDQNRTKIDWLKIKSPVILKGNRHTAYRDPAAHYHDGLFRIFHTLVRREQDRRFYWYLGVIQSHDLVHWTEPKILTPRNQNLNFSSPGNVIRYRERWILCLQTYPFGGNQDARIWRMESEDLASWSEPEIMMVKGPDIPTEKMGRMIDPYLSQDKDDAKKWWCFYKQMHSLSMSYSYDLKTWTYFGRADAGENFCVLIDEDEYVLIHSPSNGIGIKRSKDLINWRDVGLYTLGQRDWPWAQGRLTAGHILDLRDQPEIGKYIMVFHGSTKEGMAIGEVHGHASLAIAWSDNLARWYWPE